LSNKSSILSAPNGTKLLNDNQAANDELETAVQDALEHFHELQQVVVAMRRAWAQRDILSSIRAKSAGSSADGAPVSSNCRKPVDNLNKSRCVQNGAPNS
jgi:hypothetical protein